MMASSFIPTPRLLNTLFIIYIIHYLASSPAHSTVITHDDQISTSSTPAPTPTLPFSPSIYCALCIRLVEEMNDTISQTSRTTPHPQPALPQKFRIDDPYRHRIRLYHYSDEYLGDLLADTILDRLVKHYAVMEEGSLLIGRRHWRKMVCPEWLIGDNQLPAGSKMPEYWENEVKKTYNYINHEYHDQIIRSFQRYSDSILYEHQKEDITRLLHDVCSMQIKACPPSYTYPSKDLRPVKGDEFRLKFNELIPEVKKEYEQFDVHDDDYDVITGSINSHSNEL